MVTYLIRKTKKLTVRPLKLSDYKAWRNAYLNTRTQANRWDREPMNVKDLSYAKFAKMIKILKGLREQEKFIGLGVFNKTGAYVGTVSIMDIVRSITQSGYLGYFLLNGHWGKGYGKEAALAGIDIAFRDLKIHRIEAGIEPENRRSIFTARSMGLRKEGLKKRMIFKRGKWVDLIMYSATCEEFGFKWKG